MRESVNNLPEQFLTFNTLKLYSNCVTYRTVLLASTMSSSIARISLPLFALSRRNSAKLRDTNCSVEFDIIKELN